MKRLLQIIALIVKYERKAFLLGLLLTVTVLAMGVALLGLSGWFITASAAAGMAGLGILFNVFAPSAMVRFLALGRTAARYGERLLTHDATLRALSDLRIRLLEGLLTRPHRELEKLRANAFLNRVTADIDALDGALLRLVLPAFAGWVVITLTGALLWWLVHPSIGLVVGLGYLLLPTLVFLIGQRIARRPSRQVEAALMASRTRLIDLIAGRDDLTMYGQLQAVAAHVQGAFERHSRTTRKLDRIQRRTGLGLDLIGAALTASALGLGARLVQAGEISAAQAAIGVFAALALAETVAPVRRALAEIGGMVMAARRVLPSVAAEAPEERSVHVSEGAVLEMSGVGYRRGGSAAALFAPVNLTVAPGETVALAGPSGSGKSTLLLLAAGALAPAEGAVRWGGRPVAELSQDNRAHSIALVPQRHALIAGTVAENLRLAAPAAGDATLWEALESVCLAETLRARGGLDLRLGFRGVGLSGGEARRLVLARALLRRPQLLLLDEPTEGLDDATARAVMAGIRAALPEAAILMAAHRAAELSCAGTCLQVAPEKTAHRPDAASVMRNLIRIKYGS
ncbi:ATP-binding cassette domain-containing protein [Salipiger bermudensis]|uniref:amino acid ABC transporter ATP-binding/permease protein n=1 Tax=Salipiger bermudensis TaxID=344736 RepID=UPI001C9A0322|nr:ATP-binding cassette domain-containing protein [Salipiger bermudensis]MBY6004625.1 ATP-binding cassette domain-containing protein [Salipiger bermudensis]